MPEEGAGGDGGEGDQHPAGGLQHTDVRQGRLCHHGGRGSGGDGQKADPARGRRDDGLGGRQQAGEVGGCMDQDNRNPMCRCYVKDMCMADMVFTASGSWS